MQTKQLIVRSAVTVVASGLTLFSSGTSEAHGRGPSGMRISGSHGGMNRGAIHQTIGDRALTRGRGADDAIGHNKDENRIINHGRDDRGGQGERHRGNDDRASSTTAREREPGDDHGRGHREPGDDKGRRHGNDDRASFTTAREREPGDDHGREHREPGDDKGRRHGNDDKASSTTAREREPGDAHGRGHREPGDDKGRRHGNDDKASSTTARERESGDAHGRAHREPGDDKGRGEREPGDNNGVQL